ncbi:MAG: four helix bundle protein [Candidatus Dactylopiibacterium carminicum]|uniref:Four helix bundle protein n=1 Tax=Candidatus Dactylopiibacterium carminicum TaxID=857335 RepID=A0A272ERI3_9RHOO|nr:four helix bundle protein [Candidatus Dactylopiibacterium carminicum]KAF7598825.1 four helix bundle protein [Candidatus Dactylopiibacterium carminicum]PAS92719.1 MAG: four helix bundle protein [Candidatus Dactylopiibacterium carminicum]PAS96167.1 MAG: four helix bundle protein [Candidatus Dactylopiibacterium carminicum]PAS98846.1 MAG: four helix bundle protein [Candidatus Dactylopiibacterium carminicum]
MGVQRFEELQAWQKARELVVTIYAITREGAFAKDFGLRDQIQRAAVSTMSNLAEGFERGSRPDFHRFVIIAKASCAEVRSQLYIAFDIGYITEQQLSHIMKQASELARVLGGLRASLDETRTPQ